MGLIKALTSSVSSGLGDQFKEFVTCPQVDENVLVCRGEVHHGDGNKNFSDGIISNGSAIVVPQGRAMIVVENGEIKDLCDIPGTYTWDSSSEPSVFTGGFFKGLAETIKTMGNRFTFGGQTAKDQRVYYINTLPIPVKFGSTQPKKITDEKYGMIEVTFNGIFSLAVENPETLLNVIGSNPRDIVTYEDLLGGQVKIKFVEQLTQAIAVVMRKHRVSFGDIQLYNSDITNEMNNILDATWKQQFGIVVFEVSLGDLNLTDESMEQVRMIDKSVIYSNAAMQSGLMATATAESMKTAAANPNGSMMGFMGMNMASQTGAGMMGAINQNMAGAQNQPFYGNPATPESGTIFGTNNAQPTQDVQNVEQPVEAQPVTNEEQPVQETTSNEKFCTKCGTPAVGAFCGNCGNKID